MVRSLLILLIASVSWLSGIAGDGSRALDSDMADSVISQLRSRSLNAVEGIWQVAGMRSVIAIVADGRDRYNILAIDVDAPAVIPGTKIGTARPTAKQGTYDAKIYTKASPDGRMSRRADFIISVSADGNRITLHHYYKGLAVRMWRSIPYLFGATLRNRDTRPDDIDGCIRIWPAPSIQENPISL